MTREEFERIISQDPALETPLRRAAEAIPRRPGTFGPITGLAAIAVLFPVAVFVVKSIGLPWLHEAKRYSELWRQKFHRWIDTQYQKHDFDPDEAEAAGEALRRELEAITDAGAQKAWERFAGLLREVKTDEKDNGATVA